MKHLLKLGGMTPEEILHILDVADQLKAQRRRLAARPAAGRKDGCPDILQGIHPNPHQL